MPNALDRLKDGIRRFQSGPYAENAEKYKTAATTPQKPHTLMITCADSRIDIETVTSAAPGELFTTRNVGNLVPAYGEMLGGVSAVIEYAVNALGVQHIVVCGHSDCGAMKALRNPSSLDSLPTVKQWLRNAQAASVVAEMMAKDDETAHDKLRRLTERNVLLQLQHLKTHPSVAGALAQEKLTVSGWVYDLGTGEVRIAEDGSSVFEAVGATA
ncbi:carbonic anhydrase [Granulicella cerasi]|uniref:Carbonic anhydrase n=1 Tax=Granulicella cerasi TaxID=741063 RepID=A0ABW1ZCQ0_9BACT|nr:carbonic anhydrase [Granulicella cerasi]